MRTSMNGVLLLALCALWAALCVGCKIVAPSPEYYLTDDGTLWYFDTQRKGFVIHPEKLEEARTRPECRRAEQDPQGHWGPPMKGFQISVRMAKCSFVGGEAISVEAFLRNISRHELQYAVLIPDKNRMIEVRRNGKILLSKEEARPRNGSFAERLRDLVTGGHVRSLSPRMQHESTIGLSELYDLSEAGDYAVRVGRLVPGLKRQKSHPCLSDWAQFTVKNE